MSVSATLVIAIWGAVTGTGGAAAAVASRRDAVWARRARARESRDGVAAIRDVLAEAKTDPSRAATLTSNSVYRARVLAVVDAKDRCPDRKTRKQLSALSAECHSLSTIASDSAGAISFNLTRSIESALSAATDVLDRFDALDRRAPS